MQSHPVLCGLTISCDGCVIAWGLSRIEWSSRIIFAERI